MLQKNIKTLSGLIVLAICTYSQEVLAVPPPDFIIQIASQLASFFTIGIAIFSALFATSYQFISIYVSKYSKFFWIVVTAIIVGISFLCAFLFNHYYQDQVQENNNAEWIRESKTQNNFSLGVKSEPITLGSEESQENSQTALTEETNFFDLNKDTSLSVSNEELKSLLQNTDSKPFILDARENLEYEIGRIPGSKHIRFADLRDGETSLLPRDQILYVVCWSGIRGKEVAEYLRSQNIVAKYLEKGVDGWVAANGQWAGEVKFSHVYGKKNYQYVFSTAEMRKLTQKNITLVDSRSPEKYEKNHINGAINIPLMYTPTGSIDEVFGQVPKNEEFVVICDDYVNCFDAKMTGVELEKRGAIFLGRYNKPWEF